MATSLINNTMILKHNDVLVPLTVFDKAASNLNVTVLYAFRPPMPSNEVMKEGLSKVLVHYPHIAGRFTTDNQGRTCIALNNAGVRVIETSIPTTLAEKLPLDPTKDVRHLRPPAEGIEELFQVQLNRYACGGLVIGITAHHHVADGQAFSYFFVSWARVVRGLNVEPLPYHDRLAVFKPRNPPKVEFDHRSIEFKKPTTPVFASSIETVIVHYSTELTNKVKAKVVEENCIPNQRFSTFICLLTHVWKKVTQARGLDLEQCTQLRVAVNGRTRIKPAVPMEYFGNMVLWAYPKLKVKEVLNENYAYIAKVIHDEVARVDDGYFKSFIDFGEMTKRDGEELMAAAPDFGESICPDLEVDSWLRFQFHDIDFGGGSPCAFFPPNIPVEGVMMFLPSCERKGDVDLLIALLPEHVHHFKQISHCLE